MTEAAPDLSLASFSWLTTRSAVAFNPASTIDYSLEEWAWFFRGRRSPEVTPRIRHDMGRKRPGDIVWVGVTGPVVSPRFHDLLTGFSGWSAFPVDLTDGFKQPCPGYVGLAISGRCGRMQHTLTRTDVEPTWGWTNYVGLEFDLTTWDGSDIVYPVLGAGPVVSERLASVIRKAKLTNCVPIPLPEVRMEKGMIDRMIENKTGPYSEDEPPIP